MKEQEKTTALVIRPEEMSTKSMSDLKYVFCPDADDLDIIRFVNIVVALNLDASKREVYLIKYAKDKPASIVVGYEVYLKRAERSKKWNGFKVWTEGEGQNMVAKCKVHRVDWAEPFEHEVYFSEYAQYTKAKDENGKWMWNKERKEYETVLNSMWKGKPKTMLKKVVTCQAFRMAFPEDLGGMPYIEEEVQHCVDVTDKTAKPDFVSIADKEKAIEAPKEVKPEPYKEVEEVIQTSEPESKPEYAATFNGVSLLDKIGCINALVSEAKDPEHTMEWILKRYKLKALTEISIAQAENIIFLLENEKSVKKSRAEAGKK